MTPVPPPWLHLLRGKFVVFDGPDGSGKSTQFRRFNALIQQAGVPVCEVREPGGTHIGEQIRKVLLDPDVQEDVDIRCEMLLFMASRAQLIAQRIKPALEKREFVLADRFISSTLAYQGAAGGIPVADILRVGQIALGQYWPDVVIVFDVDEKTAASRLSPLLDRMEQKGAAYHRTVRQGYLDQAKADPDRYLVIDASQDQDSVFNDLLNGLARKVSAEGH